MMYSITMTLRDGGESTYEVAADTENHAKAVARTRCALEVGAVDSVISCTVIEDETTGGKEPMSEKKSVCLIDLSGIFRAHWHATEQHPVGEAHTRTLRDVDRYAGGHGYIGICIDMPPYNRRQLFPEYKAHRDKAPTVLIEQLNDTIAVLRQRYHVFGADGYEADDIIATLCEHVRPNILNGSVTVTVYSADKDLLQVVEDAITVVSTSTRTAYDPHLVETNLGVKPLLIPDLLALTGDKSDGIPGIKGVGPKIASGWLSQFGDVETILQNIDELGRFAPLVGEAAQDIRLWLELTTLQIDAPISANLLFEPVLEPPPAPGPDLQPEPEPEPEPSQPTESEGVSPSPAESASREAAGGSSTAGCSAGDKLPQPELQPTAMVPADYSRALEPRDSTQAYKMAAAFYSKRVFGDFGSPEAMLAVMMAGRVYGVDAISALLSFNVIQGKIAPSSQMLIGLAKKSERCKYFQFVRGDDTSATWRTHRKGEPEPTELTYTIQDAQRAGLASKDNWKKRPQTMLRWRCGVELARLVYPDIVSGLYAEDEMAEV